MKLLPNGNYQIVNSQTKEVKEVSAADLPKYGLQPPAPVTPAPQQPAPTTAPVNPGMSVDTAVQSAPPDQSLLGKIGQGALDVGKAIVNPVTRFGTGLGEAATKIPGIEVTQTPGNIHIGAAPSQFEQTQQEYRDTADRLTKQADEAAKKGDKAGAEKLYALAQDSLQKAGAGANTEIASNQTGMENVVKGGVGTAALLATPGGGGSLAKTVATGAIAGAGSGFGNSQTGNEVQDTLGGAILGGGTAGLLYGGGKLLAKLNASRIAGNTARTIEDAAASTGMNEKILNPQAQPGAWYAPKKEALIKAAEDMKLTGTADNMLTQIGQKADEANTQITALLQDAPPMDTNTLADNLVNRMERDTNFTPGDRAWETQFTKQTDRLAKLGDNPSPMEVYNLKSQLRGELNNTFEKLAKGNANLTPVEESKLALYYSLKDSIDTVSTEVRVINNQQHTMDDLAQGLVKSSKANRPAVFKVPVIGTEVKLPYTDQGAQVGMDSFNKAAAQKVQAAGGVASTVAGGVNQPIVRNALINHEVQANGQPSDGMGVDSAIQSPAATPPAGGTDTVPSNGTPSDKPKTLNAQGFTVEQLAQGYQNAMMAGDTKSATHLKSMYDMEVAYQKTQKSGAGSGLTTTAAGQLGELESSYKLADTLTGVVDTYKDKMGPFGGRVNAANPYDTNAQAFQSQMKLSAQVIGKALEGGVLRKEDELKYEKILPQIGDTPEVAKKKIENVKALLKQKYATMKTNFEGSSPDGLTPGMSVDQATQ
jgi:hypothetical protein